MEKTSAKKATGGKASAPTSRKRRHAEERDEEDIHSSMACGGQRVDTEKEDGEETRYGWWDPDARSLDCGICFMPFEAEVYMCNNGHAACAKCCVRINRKCWCCGQPIGDVRCRPLENVLAELNTFCRYKKFGCGESVKYVDRRSHEESCPRAPYDCPVAGCSYRGLLLYQHVVSDHADEVTRIAYLQTSTVTLHKSSPFRLLVQHGGGRVFLLLNGGAVLGGRSLSLVCLGPRRREGMDMSYKMEVHGGEPAAGSFSFTGTVSFARQLEGLPEAKGFLFLPNDHWGASGSVAVNLRIG